MGEGLSRQFRDSHGPRDAAAGDVSSLPPPPKGSCSSQLASFSMGMAHGATGRLTEKRAIEKTIQGTIPKAPEMKASGIS